MIKRTQRLLLKWSLAVNFAFFGLAYADYAFWDSVGMVAILSFYGLFLLGLIILLMLDTGPRYQRLEFQAPDEGPKTIIYRRP